MKSINFNDFETLSTFSSTFYLRQGELICEMDKVYSIAYLRCY